MKRPHFLMKLSVNAHKAFFDAIHCPLELVKAKGLLTAALELAGNLELTFYGSLYLSLALLTETSLVTADRHLKKAADQHRLPRIVILL